jgi:hypothetical protein
MAETEWWTTPGEAARRLDALTTQFGNLQNAAIGRGLGAEKVPGELADVVVETCNQYRAWRETLGGVEYVMDWKDDLTLWTERANKLRAQIAKYTKVPGALTEYRDVGPAVLGFGTIGIAAAGLALAYVISSRRR